MNDRELLELAAKAAGYVLTDGSQGYREFRCKGGVEWNPLTDDGDALRLAVSLKLNVYHAESAVYCEDQESSIGIREPHDSDGFKATRLAITRAAAAIGEAMP